MATARNMYKIIPHILHEPEENIQKKCHDFSSRAAKCEQELVFNTAAYVYGAQGEHFHQLLSTSRFILACFCFHVLPSQWPSSWKENQRCQEHGNMLGNPKAKRDHVLS
jgi:hypothetical protein